MAWIIASVPFWMFGVFFMYAVPMVYVHRKPTETEGDLALQAFFSLLVSGFFLLIAAKICS